MQIMETLIPVTIVIGDRNYRIKIEPKDEEIVRKTVKIINDKIIEFKTNFAGKDMQDYVAMALISYATEQTEIKMNTVENENLVTELNQLEKILDNHLTNSAQSKTSFRRLFFKMLFSLLLLPVFLPGLHLLNFYQ